MLRSIAVEITTDASGDATDYGGLKVTGKVVAIGLAFGNLDANMDFTITGETSGSPILTIANVAAADTFWNPRLVANRHDDGVAFTDAVSESPRVFAERIKVITADGGNEQTGTLTFYIEDDTFIE